MEQIEEKTEKVEIMNEDIKQEIVKTKEEENMRVEKIKKCRICENRGLIPILNFGVQALSGRFPGKDEPDPPKAPLELVKCIGGCGLVQLRHSVDPGELYTNSYGYRSGLNQAMKSHLKDMVEHIQEMVDLHGEDVVLDIGSNDATLLKCYSVQGLRKVGIDPLGKKYLKYYTKDIRLISDYFSATKYLSVINKKVKVITSIAMFYDLKEPMSFVGDIKKVLHTEGVWILEQSYMPSMLEMNSFDTVCHEHLEYYSLKQIDWMLKRNGLRIINVEFNDINGGSFRVYVCHNNSAFKSNLNKINLVFSHEEELKQLDSELPYKEFKERVLCLKDDLHNFLTTEKAKGKSIYIYGASTKGNTLLQFCDIDNTLITAAADRNPEKWGSRTPGSNIPILSEEEARKAKPDYFLVLPWHFKKGFIEREADFLASGGKFIFPLPKLEIIGNIGDE